MPKCVETPGPICIICYALRLDIAFKFGDLGRGEGRGCSICSVVFNAIKTFLPEIFPQAYNPNNHSNGERGFDEFVFCWNATHKTIYLENKPQYRLSLSSDSKLESELGLFSHHTASGDTGSEESFAWIVSTIENCTSQHSACEKPTSKPLPRRVLDVGETEQALIKLYDTQNEPARYACLSHRWGAGQHIKTTSETYPILIRGLRLTDLPLTFRHAVSIARRLSIRYLWIDCFCIIQDDPGDLQQECALMDVIFENAFLTIAATKSTGPGDGLFTREPQSRMVKLVQFPEGSPWGKSNVYVRNFNHQQEDNRRSQHWSTTGISRGVQAGWPLLTRAWVFQERLLSPRMIHFGNELAWECRTKDACQCNFKENGPYSKDSKHRFSLEGGSLWSPDCQPSTLYQTWKSVVENYSELTGNLTYESDIFPALSGLASRFSRLLNDDYVAGLWRKSLIEGLLWAVRPKLEAGVPRKWRAPTWSWASICGPIKYGPVFSLEETYVEVMDVTCTQAGCTPTGELLNASLTLSGPTRQARLGKVKPKQNNGLVRKTPQDELIGTWRIMWEDCCQRCVSQDSEDRSKACRIHCTSNINIDHTIPESWDGELVECLRVARARSLDLYLVLVKGSGNIGHYQRIGLTSKCSPEHQQLAVSDKRELARLRDAEELQTLTIV